MSRTPKESRLHELNLMQKRLHTRIVTVYKSIGTEHQAVGLRLAIQILGERKKEIRNVGKSGAHPDRIAGGENKCS